MDPWIPAELRAGGFTVVFSTGDECDSAPLEAAGLKHIRKYMPTAFPTNDALVAHFVDLVRDSSVALLEELARGECVLVHCFAGRDRSGLVLAATLMELENLDAQAALKRVRGVRPEAMTSPGIVNVLREYAIRFGG